jgi:IclR helix-turn-helix domain
MTAAKPTSEEAVTGALASSRGELTSVEIGRATGLGRSTVGKTLAALERAGMARRHPGGRETGRRRPDRWSVGSSDERPTAQPPTQRLRPGSSTFSCWTPSTRRARTPPWLRRRSPRPSVAPRARSATASAGWLPPARCARSARSRAATAARRRHRASATGLVGSLAERASAAKD